MKEHQEAIKVLKEEGVIIYPTDTIPGFCCDATSEKAVNKILNIKNREAGKGLISLVSSIDMLKEYVIYIHPRVENLLTFNERSLTIVYDKVKGLADNVYNENGSAAIRICETNPMKMLIEIFGGPIVATSVNVSGEDPVKNPDKIPEKLLKKADYVYPYMDMISTDGETSIVASFNKKGELKFLRE